MLMYQNLIKRFWKSNSGVAAVEAALLTPVFVPLLIAVMELLLFIFTSSAFDTAIRQTAAEIRLGQSKQKALNNKFTATEYYRQSICEKIYVKNCKERISINLETFDEFGLPSAKFNDKFIERSTLVFLEANIDVPAVGLLATFAGGKLINARAAQIFMTEPF